MTIELSEETKQKFGGRTLKRGGRTLKRGDHVLARMRLSFTDRNGNDLPDQIGNFEAYVSRIENDVPSFIAINPYDDRVMEIRQMSMPFVESEDVLTLSSWTWLWVPLHDLREGAVFVTEKGICAMKTEYRTNFKIDCYLLASGEAAHFSESWEAHNSILVREIDIPT